MANSDKNLIMWVVSAVMSLLVFFVIGVACGSSDRRVGMVLTVITTMIFIARFSVLRERTGNAFLAISVHIIVCFISALYALSGKFALEEFLYLISSYFLVIILLALMPIKIGKTETAKWISVIMIGYAAIAGIVSIDMMSTHYICEPVLKIFGKITDYYDGLSGVKANTRIYSIFRSPNIFAGMEGIAILLALSYALSYNNQKERKYFLVVLFICGFALTMTFSMGAMGLLGISAIVMLFLEDKEKRGDMLLTLIEFCILCLISAMLSAPSLKKWNGVDWVPVLCIIGGSVLICVLDNTIGKLGQKTFQKHWKLFPIVGGIAILIALVYIILGWNIHGAIKIGKSDRIRRPVEMEPGTYVISTDYDGDYGIKIEAEENYNGTVIRKVELLDRNASEDIEFTLDSNCVGAYFTLHTNSEATVHSLKCVGEKTYSVPLGYPLLPSFIATRLQDLKTGDNMSWRLQTMKSGLRLFAQSPIFGLGIGSYESAVKSVQDYYFESKGAHNHFIQVSLESGILGLASFVSIFVFAIAELIFEWKKKQRNPQVPALLSATIFIGTHAMMEMTFMKACFIVMAYWVFTMSDMCCDTEKADKKWLSCPLKIKNAILIGSAVMMIVFGVTLGCHLMAKQTVAHEYTLDSLSAAAKMDVYEGAGYKLAYLNQSLKTGNMTESQQKLADKYLKELSGMRSNTILLHLAKYHLSRGEYEDAFICLGKHIENVESDPKKWQECFDTLDKYETENNAEQINQGRTMLLQKLEHHNQTAIEPIEVTATSN